MSEAVFTLAHGTAPLLVSVPHVGTAIPDDLVPGLVPRASVKTGSLIARRRRQ